MSRGGAAALWAFTLAACLVWNLFYLCEASKERDQRYLYGWDENHYYAAARSMVFDGDVDIRNDLAYVGRLRGMYATGEDLAKAAAHRPNTASGHYPNKYGVGTAILAAPALLLSKGIAAAAERVNGVKVSRFASVHILAFIWSSILIGFLGMWAAAGFLRGICDDRMIAGVIVCGTLGTPLIFYLWFSPAMTHAAGFAAGAAFMFAARRWHEALRGWDFEHRQGEWRIIRWALGAGLCLGFGMAIRYPNICFGAALPVFGAMAARERNLNTTRGEFARSIALSVLAAGVGALIGFLPQLIFWKATYGHWLLDTYEGETMHRYPVHLLQVLAGTRNSLLLWSPVAGVAILGLVRGAMRREARCAAGLAVLTAFLWVYGSWDQYALGASFGQRGLTDMASVFMLGIAALLGPPTHEGIVRNAAARRRVVAVAAVLCVAWNLWMIGATRAGIQPMEKPFAGSALISSGRKIRKQIQKDAGKIFGTPGKHHPVLTPVGSAVPGL